MSLQVKTNVELRQPVAEKVVVDYTVYFRGNAIRRDELRHLPNGQIAKYWSVYAFGRCLRSYNDDDYIILNAAAGRNYNDLGISSPLVFGLTEKPSVSVAVKPDIVAGAWPERATSVVVKEILEGVETWRVTTTYESRRGTYWVAPGMKFSIVKYAAYWDDQVQTELLCKPKTYANGDVYFPEEVRLRQFGDRGKLVAEEVTSVLDAKFNVDVPDGMFDIKALRIPAGRKVLDMLGDSNGVRLWDGEKLVDPIAISRDVETNARNVRVSYVMIFICVLSVLVAVLALRVHTKLRRTRV
ncbi:MAG: hypothetical protein ACLQNE_09635 [Thermoguttaceae bacterium]